MRSVRTLIDASWNAAMFERVRFYSFVVLFVIAYSVDLLVPWAIGYVLGVFVKEGFTDYAYQQCLLGILAYVGLRIIHTFCHHFARYLQAQVAYSARMQTLLGMFRSFMTFSLRWHVGHHSGSNLSRLHRSVGAVDAMVGTYVWQIVEGLVKILFATVAIFALDFWVALNVLAMGLVTILMMVTFNTKVRDSIRHNNKFYDKINRICVDYLFNIVTVKTLKLEPGAKEYLGSHQNDGRSIARSIAFWTELKWGSVGFGYALVMGTSLLIYFWGHRGFEGAFDVAQVYVLMNYLDRIFQAIGSFTGYYGGIIESATAYEDADRIHRELAEEARLPAPRSVKPNWRVFSIRDLQFSYIPGERSGLRNISIDIGRADKIALVGPSGGGKSTLLKILAGMVPPEKVTIGTDQESGLSIDDVANYALLLPQEPEIFSQSLRQNLLMGDNFSQSELEYFAKFCRVEGVIEKLPGGWECDLAEKGLNMSVGEKQRVALARGLLRAKDKQILLLDEPTSSLDPLTEKAIFQDLLRQFADRAIVTACHRLALVPLFDKIVLIRNGRIEETGSFDQLLAQNGQFAAAWADYQTRVLKDEEIEDSGMMDMR